MTEAIDAWYRACFEPGLLNDALQAGRSEVRRAPHLLRLHDGDNWSRDSLQKLVEEGWIAHNWSNEWQLAEDGVRKLFCDRITSTGGIVLEIAAGPGGGNLAPVLHRDPGKRMIVNDLSASVLRLWQEFLRDQGIGSTVVLAAFDARKPALASGCVGAVSSMLGLSETHGASDVLTQCHRALISGGRIYCEEHIVNEEDWRKLPAETRVKWERRIPGLVGGHRNLISTHGFAVEHHEVKSGRVLDPAEGSLPADAAVHDVKLRVDREWIVAIRE